MTASFDAGMFHAVMGPSGSGKTTLLNLLDGSLTPDHGTIILAGRLIESYSRCELRSRVLTRVYQDYRLVPFLSAVDNVRLAQQAAGSLRSHPLLALEYLERLGVKELAEYPVDNLSGGEAQRVAIARALVNSPQVLFADEPTGALDEKNSHEIGVLLRELSHELNVCLVVVTHDPALAALADRVVEVHDYRLRDRQLAPAAV
ncbi:MAG: ATP-binding cassette domain-containing protein [Actinomycetaceae bacterium]|nr:ATP-binding cassette domain-containing protein [Actinomycetaceae bacterium]